MSDRSHSQSWELCTIAQAPWQQLRSSMLVRLMVLIVRKVYAGLPREMESSAQDPVLW